MRNNIFDIAFKHSRSTCGQKFSAGKEEGAGNDSRLVPQGRDIYLQLSRVRSGDKFIGADVLAGWYQRNFRIFSNIAPVIESSEDHVLVIFGAGHAPILGELIQSSPDLQLVEPNDYLKKP